VDEQSRKDAANTYYRADSAFIGWNAIVGIIVGAGLTVVGVLVDLRSGVYGTLILGIVILLAGIALAIFGPRLRATKRRQINRLFDVDGT